MKIKIRKRGKMLLMAGIMATAHSFGAQVSVDLSNETGSIKHGASGFLYGLGDPGIPSKNVLAPLSPQVAWQKAPNGLQHPNGDSLTVSESFKEAGGREIQIYMQDIYKEWPYENLGITDYLSKMDAIMDDVMQHPNSDMFSYMPFNEPDWIWYDLTNNRQKFFDDWKAAYDLIKSKDPAAKIAGPGLARYRADFYSEFMQYCFANNCLPDIMVWHELQNDFFTDWYMHVDHYRSLEAGLGITPREISISEYARKDGDLGVPGKLVQWMSRLENSKVDGGLAYWTTAGSLNDLVTQNNSGTGGWWLYKWYGEMLGQTVETDFANSEGLAGLATVESSKKQARVVFGGAGGTNQIVVNGFYAASYLGSTVHATIWETPNTGLSPAARPTLKLEGDYTVSNGQITVEVSNMDSASGYHMILTPNTDTNTASNNNRYEAEYASIGGSAAITYSSNTGYSGTYFVEGYGGSNDASTEFVVYAEDDGYYNLDLRYSAGPYTGAPTDRSILLTINDDSLGTLPLTGTPSWNAWTTASTPAFLSKGINRVRISAYTNDDVDAINIDYLDVLPTTDSLTTYEADSSVNTLSGTAVVSSNTGAANGSIVGYLGNGSENYLEFQQINVPTSGMYRMVVRYANGELGDGASNYNSNIVDRYADISVNDGPSQKVYFRNTLGWETFYTTTVNVSLTAGDNTIRFSNDTAYAPDIDLIRIAEPVGVTTNTGSLSGVVNIVNRNSEKCLKTLNSATSNGASVVQYTCDNTLAQQWDIVPTGINGTYNLIQVSSGKLADIYNASTAQGANNVIWPSNGGKNQQWNIVYQNDGSYHIINDNSDMLLDIYEGSTEDNANNIQWPDNNGENQDWMLVPVQQ